MPKEGRVKKIRVIPYVRGFKPPTERAKSSAVITKGEQLSNIGKAFSAESGFKGIPKCESIDDWLAQYRENGQNYEKFLLECPWLSNRKPRSIKMDFEPSGQDILKKYPDGKVYILPLGNFNNSDITYCIPDLKDISEYCKIFLGLPTVCLPAVELRAANGKVSWWQERAGMKGDRKLTPVNIKCRYHRKSTRYQINITDVLAQLRKFIPDDAVSLVALTMFELYEDESDLFVAGMAAGNHRVAVFSLLRYDPNLTFSAGYWYDIQPNQNHNEKTRKHQTLQRSCKLVVHEICHLLGLDHCIYYLCCMNGSGHLEEDFKQPMHLCPVDLRKLHKLCGFNIIHRYQQLATFYKKCHMTQEHTWVTKRLAFLGQ